MKDDTRWPETVMQSTGNGVGRDPRHYDYVDALRGYAILMVMAVHTVTRDTQPQWLAKLGEQGARGVDLFFVVSAFTLCLSWAARDDIAPRFYLRRFFRIAPMFWLAIPFFLYLRGWEENGVRQVIASATFTHGLWPDTLMAVVPGGWSVGTEAIFYALFPFAIVPLMTCRWRTFIIVMAVAIIGGQQLSRPLGVWYQSHPELWNNGSRFYFDTWFPRLLPCFLIGVALYRLHAQGVSFNPRTSVVLTITGAALFVAMALLYGVKYAVPFGLSTTSAFCFFLIILGLFDCKPRILVNPAMIWIGKVSYSVYFLHFAVLLAIPTFSLVGLPSTHWSPRLAHFAIISAVSVALGSITYVLVERNGVRLGRRLEHALFRHFVEKKQPTRPRPEAGDFHA